MSKNGFTLLELAVVLAIIGLIVGSIFVGQSLVRASELQTAIGEYDAYVKATNEFQMKFLAMPGDMNNAESMWGSDASCPNTPVSLVPHTATCNGDGNGTVGASDFNANLSGSTEWFRAWQQLSDAGFMAQGFTGTAGTGGAMEGVVGQNMPGSAINRAGWMMMYYSLTSTSASMWGDQYGHVLLYGGFAAGNYNVTPILTAGEAFAMDQKIDDGNPGMGLVRAWRTAMLPNCTTTDTAQNTQAYAKTDRDLVCSLMFLMRM